MPQMPGDPNLVYDGDYYAAYDEDYMPVAVEGGDPQPQMPPQEEMEDIQ